MELKQLEAFVHVVELGSFSRAAVILDTDQPALSRLVRQLETELRQTLLYRHGRGVAATDAGQVMLGHAKGMLQQAERARDDLQRLRGAVAGHFSVGLAPSFAKIATNKLVHSFRRHFPQATISVAEGLSTHLAEWLMMGRIDAAVMYDVTNSQLIARRSAYDEELFLIGPPPASPAQKKGRQPAGIRLEQIADYPLVIPGRMHAMRRVVEARSAEIGVKLSIALEVDAVTSILDLVDEGFGYAILPLNATMGDALQRGFAVTRITPTLYSRLTIATSTQHTLSHLADQALGILEKEMLPLYTSVRQSRMPPG